MEYLSTSNRIHQHSSMLMNENYDDLLESAIEENLDSSYKFISWFANFGSSLCGNDMQGVYKRKYANLSVNFKYYTIPTLQLKITTYDKIRDWWRNLLGIWTYYMIFKCFILTLFITLKNHLTTTEIELLTLLLGDPLPYSRHC